MHGPELLSERRYILWMSFAYAVLPIPAWLMLMPLIAFAAWLTCPDRMALILGGSVVVPLSALIVTVPHAMWQYLHATRELEAEFRERQARGAETPGDPRC